VEVEGNFRVDPGDEVHDGADRLLGIVLPGDEEIGDLHMRFFRALLDRGEHRSKRSPADLPVELRVHRLQVDVHRVHQGEKLGEWLRGDETVGDENVGHPGLPEFPRAIDDEFEPYQRLVVGVGDPDGPFPPGGANEVGNGHGSQRRRAFHQVMVLAESAVKVAPDRTDRQNRLARVEVVEGFLLHRVELDGGHLTVSEGEKPSLLVLTHLADTPFPFGDEAAVGAQFAPNGAVLGPPVGGRVEFNTGHGTPRKIRPARASPRRCP
jgi:hypothetical protein